MANDEIIDARGLKCPLPVLRLRKRIRGIDTGETIILHADDPAAVIDVPHYCNESGHLLISTTDAPDGGQLYTIKKQ